ncbi:MAG: FixH family protein [Gammaproteobacteria bacterium]|nr:FixH family protein [Gammaproteobacteria bacterium]
MQDIMQANEQDKPWYRHPLVWMMISIPFSAVIMGVVMLWLAVDTDDGLVADDYYKQGLAINSDISRDTRAAEIGLSAIIEFDSNANVIKMHLDNGSLQTMPELLVLHIQHATRANSDVQVTLNHGINDQYIGYLAQPLSEGIWYFELADQEWKIKQRSRVQGHNVIHLQSDY